MILLFVQIESMVEMSYPSHSNLTHTCTGEHLENICSLFKVHIVDNTMHLLFLLNNKS